MKNIKRVVAIACIILLVGLYVVTLILAITDSSVSMNMFKDAMTRSGRKNYYTKDDISQDEKNDDTSNQSN